MLQDIPLKVALVVTLKVDDLRIGEPLAKIAQERPTAPKLLLYVGLTNLPGET